MSAASSAFPTGNACILRLARTFDGLLEGGESVKYRCRGGSTERMTGSVTFRITAKDQSLESVPLSSHGADGSPGRAGDASTRRVCPRPGP
jgi:hypothetical protein